MKFPQLIKENGKNALPITTYNYEIVKIGEYPSLEEMEKRIGDEADGN